MANSTRRRYLSKRVCLAVLLVALPLLLWLEVAKPALTDDPILAPLVSMTLTRLLGAAVFLALLLHEGYRVIHPFQKPFLRSLLFTLPPFLVVVNNLPILSLAWGDAYLIHTAPVYLVWFSLECLAIGLFEELAFRGVIFLMLAEKRHTTRKGLFWSLILTSAVFGAVHLVNVLMGAGIGGVILQIGYSFLIGAMCSVVLLKTRNIWLCVLLHGIYDFCGRLLPALGGGTWWDIPTVVFTAVLAVATAAYLVWQFFTLDLKRVGDIFHVPNAPEAEVSEDALKDHHT
jgi:membrane protease YdiL (CAAX protease family)